MIGKLTGEGVVDDEDVKKALQFSAINSDISWETGIQKFECY